MTARLPTGLRRSLVATGVACLAFGAARPTGADDPPPPPTIDGSVKADGSEPPMGSKPDLDKPGEYKDFPTIYSISGAKVDYELDIGNPLPRALPHSFTGTTGSSPNPRLFSVITQTYGKKKLFATGPAESYIINPYFIADEKIVCESPACSGPLNKTVYAVYGSAKGTVTLPDGTPLPAVRVDADPSYVPTGGETIFVSKSDLTNGKGIFDFSASGLGPTRAAHPECFPPDGHYFCETVPFAFTNNWGLRVLGDGGVENQSKLTHSNKPGEFKYTIRIPGAQPPAMPKKEQEVTVKSSTAAMANFILSFKEWVKILEQQPWPDPNGRPEDNDGLEDNDEKDEENMGPCSDGPHPVSLLTGNVFLDQTDVSIPGLRHPLAFTRSYNSHNTVDGRLGRGWVHNFEKRIEVRTDRMLGLWVGGLPRLFTDPGGTGIHKRFGKAVSSTSSITKTADGFLRSFRTGGSEVYRADGRLIRQVDRTGRATTLTYDGNDALTEVVSPEGRRLRFEYSALLKRIVGPEGVVAEFDYYDYDGFSVLSRVRYADGSGYQFTYDDQYRLLDVSDLMGTVLDRHGYEGDRAAWSELNAGRERHSYSYEDGQTIVTDERGLVSTFEWQEKLAGKFVTAITGCGFCGAASGTRTWKRDDEGRVTRYTDADGHVTTYTWVGTNLGEVQDGAGRRTTYGSHDAFGRAGTIARTGFGTTSISYSLEGPTSIHQPTGQTTQITYQNQRVKSVQSGGGLTSTFDINDLGEVKGVTDSRGKTTHFSHDLMGRPTSAERPDGQIVRYHYDTVGRPAFIERPDGKKVHLGYDAAGRLVSVTDPAGRVTRMSYDSYDRVEAVVDPQGGVTRLAYDVMSNPTSVTDALNHKTAFDYDDVGRVEAVTDAQGASEHYEYYPSGRLHLRRDRRGVETTYFYDGAGRLTAKHYSDGTPNVTIAYDDDNRKISLSNGTDTVTVAFDLSGRVVSETSSRNGTTVTYTYNDDHQRETVRLDGSLVASYSYLDGYLDGIHFSGKELRFSYDDLGRRERLFYPNGLVTRYEYVAALGWLEKIKTLSGGAPLWEWAYTHDAVGNRTSKTTPDGTETYGYDAGDRLVKAERPEDPSGETFAYDLVGNRLREQSDSLSRTLRYDATNRLQVSKPGGRIRVAGTTSEPAGVTVQGQPAKALPGQAFEAEVPVEVGDNTLVVEAKDSSGNRRTSTYSLPVAAGDVTYSHDPNGNLVSKTDASGTWTYEWNAENELVRVVKEGAEVARFAYDALGRRVEKVTLSITTSYVYSGKNILRETRSEGTVITSYSYIHGPGLDEPLARLDSSGTIAYYHADGLGSIVKMSDQTGNITSTRRYDAWGNLEVGADQPGYAFTGREWDPETGLYYYRARYYDPKLGRFIQEDPLGMAQGPNVYSYVHNNPLNWVDPWGLQEAPAFPYGFREIDPLPGGVNGPRITFGNDDPSAPAPIPLVDTRLAEAIELAALLMNTDININSISGGTHVPTSRHYISAACDINRVGNRRVDDPGNRDRVRALQDLFADNPQLDENFGPTRNERTRPNGTKQPTPRAAPDHRNHVHVSVDPWRR